MHLEFERCAALQGKFGFTGQAQSRPHLPPCSKFTVDIVDDNIYLWRIMLVDFEPGRSFRNNCAACSSNHCVQQRC